MAGNTRFELASASPESNFVGNYQNGQRGYSAPTIDRSASFRESVGNRIFGSGKANLKGSATSLENVPALSQLILDPIVLGDKKYSRPSDLKRVLGFGNGSEDNSFGATHPKSSPAVAVDELKRFRASVADTCEKASGRAKKFDEHLNKLNTLVESMSPKKQQRNEQLTNDRSGCSTIKMGSQIPRNPPDLTSQKVGDRPKNVGLSKRVRTSVAETRAECRNNGVLRQPLLVNKDRDLLKNNNADSDMVEEKIRRLPAVGEGWDKKMKRKRSVGPVFPRSTDNDREPKRAMHHKLTSESSMQPIDSTHGFRSGASIGCNKMDPTSSPAGSSARTTIKNEQEKSVLSRDLSLGPIKERAYGKVNVKLNNREDNHSMCPSPILKGKASRAPRSGSVVAANSTANVPRVSGTLESWEQPPSVNKATSIGGPNNRKRATPAGSSSPPITQWVGQRPQKNSRTRRTNLIPVSAHDEVQMQSEGCSPSDFGPRLSTGGSNVSLPSNSTGSLNQNFKVKFENVPSPARLSESEESGASENRIKERLVAYEEKAASAGQAIGPFTIPIKKKKSMIKEEIGDGVRRQGRSGRVSPFSRTSISPTREKLDNVPPAKPLRNSRSGSDRNGSKSGRPLKKLSDRKGFSRLGHVAYEGSPDCTGESEDDREELLEAANLAYNSSANACSNPFWKTMETLFTPIGPDDKSYLSEQLKLVEESSAVPNQKSIHGNHVQMKLDENGYEQSTAPNSSSLSSNGCIKHVIESKNSMDQMDFVEQLQNSSLLGCSDADKKYDINTPIYQRVLSALIMDDEIEECEETGFAKPRTSVNDSCSLFGSENKHMDMMDFCEPIFDVQAQKNGNAQIVVSCNRNKPFDRSPTSQDHLCNGEPLQRDCGYVHSEVEVLVRLSRCEYGPQSAHTNNCNVSSFDRQYEHMRPEEKLIIELQSLDLFLDPVPPLDDKEDELINEELVQLERLQEQVKKKKACLDKLCKVIQEDKNIERRDPEHVAMDRLVELAYKKLLATRGSFASKHGIPKVSKQVALAFVRRTLARCQKFEDSGISCFSEPALRDIIYAAPPRFDESELLTGANPALANGYQSDHTFAKNGPTSTRKKREVLLDDVVGGSVSRASSALGILNGAKGKRSAKGGSKGERKPKSKPKQKIAQLSTSGNGFVNKFADTPSASGSGDSNNSNRKKDVRFMSSSTLHPVQPKPKDPLEFADLPLNNITAIDELGVDPDIGAPQNLDTWFNFEVDGIQEGDEVGLQIPMDDIDSIF